MIFVNLILAIFVGLIIHHIMYNTNIIEGLDNTSTTGNNIDNNDKGDNNVEDNSTEYTAAKVNVELGVLKKDLSNAKERVKNMNDKMKDLSSMKETMNKNTTAILALQKAVVKLETNTDS